MGRGIRTLPKNLPEKLRNIRLNLDYNFQDMGNVLLDHLETIAYKDIKIYRGHIKEFEQGKREPQIPILLAYANLANVFVDVLIDDNLHLPENIPCKSKSTGALSNKKPKKLGSII